MKENSSTRGLSEIDQQMDVGARSRLISGGYSPLSCDPARQISLCLSSKI